MSDESKSLWRALIVDDEQPARALIREYLSSHPEIKIVGEASDGFTAAKMAASLSPNLVFLDIQMPKLDGFEVLDLLDPNTSVVFATAYDSFAIRAFEVNAVDYLLKPFSQERFDEALERAKQRHSVTHRILADAMRERSYPLERVVVRDGTTVNIVSVATIDYIQSQGDYIEIRAGKQNLLKQQSLQSMEQSLDGSKFVRIHRSVILNVERLARIEPLTKESKVVVLKDGTTLPMSRSGEGRLREVLGE